MYGTVCWWSNGAAAGGSLLQFLTTTRESATLNDIADAYLEDDAKASEELKQTELQFARRVHDEGRGG